MNQDELVAVFDQQAAGYDSRWDAIAPIRDALYLVTDTVLLSLPDDARILSVGAGTGKELAHLAERFPRWTFTAVDPSAQMLAVCRDRAETAGFADRCTFHNSYLESVPAQGLHDGAICFLVSQFILDRRARTSFFAAIADRLRPGGVLVSADLAGPPDEFDELVRTWMTLMAGPEVTDERVAAAATTYRRDVAVLDPLEVVGIVTAAGFALRARVFQAGLLHGWAFQRDAAPDS